MGKANRPAGGDAMEAVKGFLDKMIRQAEEDLTYERDRDAKDLWVKFLEGELHAFKLVRVQIDRLEGTDEGLH